MYWLALTVVTRVQIPSGTPNLINISGIVGLALYGLRFSLGAEPPHDGQFASLPTSCVVYIQRDCVRGMPQQALHYFGAVVTRRFGSRARLRTPIDCGPCQRTPRRSKKGEPSTKKVTSSIRISIHSCAIGWRRWRKVVRAQTIRSMSRRRLQ